MLFPREIAILEVAVADTKAAEHKQRHLEGKELSSTMSEQRETPNPLDPFEAWTAMRDASLKSWTAMRDANLEALSKMMIDLVNSEAYSQATGQWLDAYLTLSQPFQRVLETTMTQVLTRLNMPVGSEVTSLAERLTNVEMRLDDIDAKLDDIKRAIQALAASNRAANKSAKAKEAH
jgi:ribosomal protein L12E/L44/L45/RPP1/RPP2